MNQDSWWKDMTRSIVLTLVLLGVVTSSSGTWLVGKENDAALLRKARQKFVSAINARDPDLIAACLSPDAVFLVHNQTALQGRELLRETLRGRFQNMLESGITSELTMETTRLEYSGDLAYELGRYSFVRRLPDGTTKNPRGKYADVWRRGPDGQWQIVVHAPSEDPAPHEGTQK